MNYSPSARLVTLDTSYIRPDVGTWSDSLPLFPGKCTHSLGVLSLSTTNGQRRTALLQSLSEKTRKNSTKSYKSSTTGHSVSNIEHQLPHAKLRPARTKTAPRITAWRRHPWHLHVKASNWCPTAQRLLFPTVRGALGKLLGGASSPCQHSRSQMTRLF